jgi:glucose/arabinose dehydrogenase
VYALPDRNGDGVAGQVNAWADGLRQPHGLAIRAGYLYVGETHRVVRFRVGPDGAHQGGPEPVIRDLPSGSGHFARAVSFSPDSRLLVSAGSSCTVYQKTNPRRAAI